MLQAAIFDFNGVLVDDEFVHLQLFQQLLSPLDITLTHDQYFATYFVHDDAGAFRHILQDRGVPCDPDRLRNLCAAKSAAYQNLPDSSFRFFTHAESLARDASLAVPCAIASGARGDEIRRHLHSRGLASCFRAVVSIDDVRVGKPDPEVYLEAARRLCISPAACVAFEDSPGGLESARRAGMKTVAVAHSVPRERLQADLVLDTFEGTTWASLARRLAGGNMTR